MFSFVFYILGLGLTHAYKNPHYIPGRTTMVHLFEWKWKDVADECEFFLGPKGFAGVQISPPNENMEIWSRNRPWYERYQPVSYRLITRSGNEEQFIDMVRRCNNVGVRVFVDIVINHMASTEYETMGTGGSLAYFNDFFYPAVPYGSNDFNKYNCVISVYDYTCCPERVRTCELSGLKDLNQGNEYVRHMIVEYMNRLIVFGVAGFRIDSAKYMWPGDLKVIYDRLHNLNINFGFPSSARPFIYQEVIDLGNEAISHDEYTPIGAITEYKYGMELSDAFQRRHRLAWLEDFGPPWGMVESGDAVTFIENYLNQRGYGGDILTYKNARIYKGAIAFMLAHPYGYPKLFSGYDIHDSEAGPPMDKDKNIITPFISYDDTCVNGWICEHRWHQIYSMVNFRNIVTNSSLNMWWDNGSNQIAFCRGRAGFIAFNNDLFDLNEDLQTCLPAGVYCDIITGENTGNICSGKMVVVRADGLAQITLKATDPEVMLAIHVGKESRL